jgi:hypothetical protein
MLHIKLTEAKENSTSNMYRQVMLIGLVRGLIMYSVTQSSTLCYAITPANCMLLFLISIVEWRIQVQLRRMLMSYANNELTYGPSKMSEERCDKSS